MKIFLQTISLYLLTFHCPSQSDAFVMVNPIFSRERHLNTGHAPRLLVNRVPFSAVIALCVCGHLTTRQDHFEFRILTDS